MENHIDNSESFLELLNALKACKIEAQVIQAESVVWLKFPTGISLHEKVGLMLNQGAASEEQWVSGHAQQLLAMIHDFLNDNGDIDDADWWNERRLKLQKDTHYKMVYFLQLPDKYQVICKGWGTHPDFQCD